MGMVPKDELISCERPVAYFCAEFGLQADLPLYAGGLGILAGDTVKEAADQNLPMVAVGLLYRGGCAIQKLDEYGWQTEENLEIDPVKSGFEHVYVPEEDQPLFVRIHLTKVDVWARVWKRTVNQTTLYLLDTDTDQNEPQERDITNALYYGDEETLIKQQMILGIGGVKLLDALEIHPCLYHVNEGRPAFLFWQLIRRFMESMGLTYIQAYEKAKALIVYTKHTLVRAGNQDYDTQLIKDYGYYYAEKMKISIDELLRPGVDATTGKFNVTEFALNSSRKASAVSQPHYELSRSLWPEHRWVNITNGIHLPTWQDHRLAEVKDKAHELWTVHQDLKRELAEFVVQRSGFGYDPQRLVVVWSRRIAAYKRLQAIFEDVDRLAGILSQSDRPVQLLIAGKAHGKDEPAKQILKDIIGYMRDRLNGHAIYVPNYDIDAAKMLVKGADVWLNTPIQGQEASGTSGMKAISNGVLQLTVLDGWAAEVDWHGIGWTLDSNDLSETLYFRLQHDVVPSFYERNEQGVPEEWVERMQKSMQLSDHYSTRRMLAEYREKLYRG